MPGNGQLNNQKKQKHSKGWLNWATKVADIFMSRTFDFDRNDRMKLMEEISKSKDAWIEYYNISKRKLLGDAALRSEDPERIESETVTYTHYAPVETVPTTETLPASAVPLFYTRTYGDGSILRWRAAEPTVPSEIGSTYPRYSARSPRKKTDGGRRTKHTKRTKRSKRTRRSKN
jgi:hypothetical protein